MSHESDSRWTVIDESGPSEFDLALVLSNPEWENTDRDLRLVVRWEEAEDEPEITAVYPCRECGWAGACDDGLGCHS